MLLGFRRGVGYFFSIIIIIIGLTLFPIGLIGVVLGFIFIWMLRRSARKERIERQVKQINERNRTMIENANGKKEAVDERNEELAPQTKRREGSKEAKNITERSQEAAYMASAASYVAADAQDKIAAQDNHEEYEDDDYEDNS